MYCRSLDYDLLRRNQQKLRNPKNREKKIGRKRTEPQTPTGRYRVTNIFVMKVPKDRKKQKIYLKN